MARLSSEQVRRDNNNEKPSSVTSLNLSHRAPLDVSCLRDFRNLGRLDVSCNNLTTLEGISSCFNLTWLSVAQNKLRSLKGVECLSKLTVLNASKNMLGSMDDVRSLSELRALILNDNEISSICKLDHLKHLNTLVLSRNPIYEIGLSLKNPNSITKLSLSNCQIPTIGSSLTFCLNLKELRLADNEITCLPAELAQNIKLQSVDLGKNLIMKLSDLKVLSDLHSLKNLNLQGNPVAENPKLIKKIKKLVPNLQIFNAKPIERWNQSKKSPEKDISMPTNSDHSPQDATVLEPNPKVKRKKSEADATPSGKKRSDTITVSRSIETRKEMKTKKPKVADIVVDGASSSMKKDEKSSFNANVGEENGAKKEQKPKQLEDSSKSEGFDDKEISFMDLILSEDAREDRTTKRFGSRVAWDEKLLRGVVVDHTKRNAKNSRRGVTALQVVDQAPDVGMGGLSTWDD